MNQFTMQDLKRLAAVKSPMCISMYMPTSPDVSTVDEQRIRFKNLLRQARKTVQARAGSKKPLYDHIEAVQYRIEADNLWRYQSDGLAVFIAPEVLHYFRLPLKFDEKLWVADRFFVKPLIPLFMADGRFYILAISQSEIRLFDCNRYRAVPVDVPDLPDGMDAWLSYDNKQSQLQFHTGTPGNAQRPAVFHGHGVSVDDNKDEIRRYFQDVDRALSDVLDQDGPPLVLAGVDYLQPIFRQASSYRWVKAEGISGNPETLRAEQLHESALDIVQPDLEMQQREAEKRYAEMAGKGYTAAGVSAVLRSAVYGRVDTLFVALDREQPGIFDPQTNTVHLLPPDDPTAEDLLDRAAVETMQNGGRVYALPVSNMPENNSRVAAILRY